MAKCDECGEALEPGQTGLCVFCWAVASAAQDDGTEPPDAVPLSWDDGWDDEGEPGEEPMGFDD